MIYTAFALQCTFFVQKMSGVVVKKKLKLLGSFAEHERLEIKARQRAGIDSAKAKGQKFGRPALKCPDNFKEVYDLWKAGSITAVEGMKRTGLKRNKFYDFVKEVEKVNAV